MVNQDPQNNLVRNENTQKPGILDAVSFSQQSAQLRTFNPQGVIMDYLGKLNERERQILICRYGLSDGQTLTLETIGQKMSLTRERVRQIEKDALKKLKTITPPQSFESGVDLLFQIIEENGNAMRQDKIFDSVLVSQNNELGRMGILFMLSVSPRFHMMKETSNVNSAFSLQGFDPQLFEQATSSAEEILEANGRPMPKSELFSKIAARLANQNLSEDAIESYLAISKKVNKNPYEEWGLKSSLEINPKDVGDKAFLVLEHLKKPEHYVKITELINKSKFDSRVAQKETVHNELIKDKRFVLVGRGIYALAVWGYKSGVVADIIEQILRDAGTPLGKDEIIEKVLGQRLVKRNTIIVGLSNKKRFGKISDGKYIITPKDVPKLGV